MGPYQEMCLMPPVCFPSPSVASSTPGAPLQEVSPPPGAPHRRTAGATMCRASGVTVTQTPAQAALGADHQEEATEGEAAAEEDQEEDLEEDLVEDLVDDLGENKTNLFVK